MTGRIGSRYLALVASVIILTVCAVLFFARGESPQAAVERGLRLVEIADAAGVERIENALLADGRLDEAAVVKSAWLARRGRYDDVLRQLPPEMLDGPQRRHVMRLAGESLFRMGDFAKAELLLVQLTAEFPKEVAAHRVLSAMYYDLGANDLALDRLRQIEVLDPRDYRPHHLAGIIHADAEDFVDAIKQFRQALDKHPPTDKDAEIRLELAAALVSNRDYQAAIDLLATAAPSSQRSAILAECRWSLGDAAGAGGLVDAILRGDPENRDALRLQSRLLDEKGQMDAAAAALRKVLAHEPYDIETRYLLVQQLGAAGLTAERDREQQEYLRWRQLHDRLVKLNQQASDEPDSVEPRRELVQVCRELGRHQLAEVWRRSADYCEQRQRARTTPSSAATSQSPARPADGGLDDSAPHDRPPVPGTVKN